MSMLRTIFILLILLISDFAFANQLASDTPKITLKGNPLMCIKANANWSDSGRYTLVDKDWSNVDITVSEEGCEALFVSMLPGIYKFRYKAINKAGNVGYSAYRYIIKKAPGDNSPCILTDSLKDTCMKLAPASAIEKQVQLLREIHVYPMPSSQTVHIVVPDGLTSILNVRVMNMSGRCMLRQEYTRQNIDRAFTVNVSSLASGMYLLELQMDEAIISKNLPIVR